MLWGKTSRPAPRVSTLVPFICAVVITNACLKYLQALTSSLQAEAKDIVAAVKEIDTVTATLQSVRDNIDTHHSQWFLLWRRCVQMWAPSLLCLGDAADKSIVAMFPLTLPQSNTAVPYRSPCSITCYLR